MSSTVRSAATILAAIAVGFGAMGMGAQTTGKQMFGTMKCSGCHSIGSQGIGKVGNGTDLSKVGRAHNAAWLEKFLLRTETLNGAKHKVAFKGSAAQAKTLATWLATLK